jgi:hypothetical protein
MATLVFVHGTGVRAAAFASSFRRIGEQLKQHAIPVDAAPCLWGPSLGASLNASGNSIPTYGETLAVVPGTEPDEERALWSLLYRDPFYELRCLGRDAGSVAFVPGTRSPGAVLEEAARKLTRSATVLDVLPALEVTAEEFSRAADAVLTSRAWRDAARGTTDSFEPHRQCLARAIVAELMWEIRQSPEDGERVGILDADARDNTVQWLAQRLAPSALSVTGWLAAPLVGLAKNYASRRLQRKRGAVSNAASPAAGDVLLYLCRGEPIRRFIKEAIEACRPPVLLLAHSLGGIASVDLLVREPMPAVKLLVTVGSQAPYLYEINALPSLPFGASLPDAFPTWLNLYDLNDFLSYVGGKVFPDRVTDVRVDNRQPFPESHSAYWSNVRTWHAIKETWAKINRPSPGGGPRP